MESEDEIHLPRAKMRPLHLNEESEVTSTLPTVDDISSSIKKAKDVAMEICNGCDMELITMTRFF